MGEMKELTTQIEQVCELCPSKYCVGCKISVKIPGQNIIVNGATREIESIKQVPNFI